jgi:hypothetical protein
VSKSLLKVGAITFALALAGCASAPPVQMPVKVRVPAALMTCDLQPAGDVSTNGGLAQYVRDLKDAGSACERVLEALREWDSTPLPTQN